MSEIPTNLLVDFVFRGDCAVESKWARAFMNVCGRSAGPAPHAVQIILPQPFGPVGSKLSISTRRLTVSPYSVTASKICFLISARGVLRHRSSNAYCSLCHHGRDMAEVGSFPLTYVTISTVTLSALKRMTINP